MSVRSRVRSGFGLLALVGAVAVAVDVGVVAVSAQSAPRPTAAANCPAVHTQNPYAVAQRFISAAVERKDLRHSYGLATAGLRHGVSCRDWVKGKVPLPKVANIDWKRSGYKPVAGGSAQLILRIFLAQPNAVLPASFLMELRQQPDGWHVGFFQRDQAAPASPALAA
jgi:hypothetical protein